MRKKRICADCGKALKKDEYALSQKLLDEDEGLYCMDCMADYLGCSTKDLEVKIQEFKEQGCTLFI